jgi:puromycin-sensitive aminopeptidase
MSEADRYRLPRNVTPDRYELTLSPDMEASTFTGQSSIQVTVHEATNEIRLNALELEIFTAEAVNAAGDTVAGETNIDAQTEVATISLENEIEPGSYVLNLTFAGSINDKLAGFYRSTFTDDEGIDHMIATTQFEATDARRAFPCWDEPDLKAVFAITLIVDEHLAAYSNAEIRETTPLGNGKRQVEFADTIKMSTYLVAYVVGPLVSTEPIDVDGVQIRVICVPGRESLTGYALECASSALRYLTDYFGIRYPAGKIDLIALPDFAAGAMENFGCITFRETALLVDPKRASRREMERVAEVVGHELAHMWFGDLVTMKWWNGLWLNEAFATLMENLFVDHFQPEWGRWTSFGVGKAAAMDVDGLESTRPIEFNVASPEQAQEMFDLLTYKKGGSVLRMLEQHIGPETFRRGISNYLNKHAYGNAETTDLWDAIDEVSDQPVRSMMDSWIFQGGHPVISAELSGTSLSLEQKRFLFLGADDPTQWTVPVAIRTAQSSEQTRVLVDGPTASVDLEQSPEWLVVNARGNGFYPVRYSPQLLDALCSNISELDSLERFGLVTDTWNACRAGETDIDDVLKMVLRLKDDSEPNVWRSLGAPLRALDHLVETGNRPAFRKLVQSFAQPNFERLGWERSPGESELTASLRSAVIGILGGIGGDQSIRAEAAERFNRYQSDPSALDAELVATAQLVLAATNEVTHYETLLSRFKNNASSPQEKIVALQALACFDDHSLVHRTLGLIQDNEIRSQDAPLAIAMMLTRRKSASIVWDWIENEWDHLIKRLPANLIDRMIEGVTACYEPELLQRVDAFLIAHPVPQALRALTQTREKLEVNLGFYNTNKDRVPDLLG